MVPIYSHDGYKPVHGFFTWTMSEVNKDQFLFLNTYFVIENWISILAIVSFSTTTVGSIEVARMTDYLKGHMKITNFYLFAGALLSLVCIGVSKE